MAEIETLLNSKGKGVLTKELHRLFVANGCQPQCHICNKSIKVGDNLHLKPFFMKVHKTDMLNSDVAEIIERAGLDDDVEVPQVGGLSTSTSSIDVMICDNCSKASRKLPKKEADKLLATAFLHGMIDANPKSSSLMGAVAPTPRARSQRSYGHYSGGCMVVRKAGEVAQIIGSGNDQPS